MLSSMFRTVYGSPLYFSRGSYRIPSSLKINPYVNRNGHIGQFNPAQRRAASTKRKRVGLAKSFIYKTGFLGLTTLLVGTGGLYLLHVNDHIISLPPTKLRSSLIEERQESREKKAFRKIQDSSKISLSDNDSSNGDKSAWGGFSRGLDSFSSIFDIQWASISDGITDFIIPDWTKAVPDLIHKLQRELSMAPGSLADEIWQEAHDPSINPEILHHATVRISDRLCAEEQTFLEKRRKVTTAALAKYLNIPEWEVHPDDVPCIAMVGSGGGLRALVAGTGSFHAASEDGLFQCATYTAGVSGSTWLQALYHSSLANHRFDNLVAHLKARLGTHIAYPPVALAALNQAPTNKFLLSGFVEKLKGDPQSDFGLVDVYGLLLAARLLVPKGELEVNDRDLKISNQRAFLQHGEYPMPIYSAVRHEIPILEEASETEKITDSPSEETKEKAKQESWFQWFEITPYELFCEEFSAGIPTWSMGRKFKNGRDLPQDESGLRVPELRLPLLLGVFGSAFCATLAAYYKEVRPILKGLRGFGGIDDMIEGRNDDLSKMHPIDPASIPNFCLGLEDSLPATTPKSLFKNDHLQLMDAGMSNNLPIYPLLRPGRDVDILIAFDASADIKTENWISVADGYARQRGVKGWPLGAGWPKETDAAEVTAIELDKAETASVHEADRQIQEAESGQQKFLLDASKGNPDQTTSGASYKKKDPADLGYCTVWVGTTEEREHTDPSSTPTPKAAVPAEDWQLMEPNAGIAVIYFPFLSNPKVEGVDPVTSPYMSTWNFVYTPEDIENVITLARTNFEEGKETTKRAVRAVYERKKRIRQAREEAEKLERFRRKLRLGIVGKTGEGDHFS